MAELPELRLDDFYHDHDEPGLPRVRGMVDWDDVASWNLPAAVEALGELAADGQTVVPCYDISRSRADGTHVVDVGDATAVPAGSTSLVVSSAICDSTASPHPC